MSDPIARLRAADPAAGLGPQPDERGEADLRLLLTEPHGAAHAVPVVARRRTTAPVLVTAAVAVVLVALTAAVLGVVHPRADPGGNATVPASIAPTLGTSACHPARILPFQCGTYESTFGGKAVTGDLGGPAKDRLRMSFTPKDGALLLTASTIDCFAEKVLVRYDGKRLIRIGTPVYSQNGCYGRGADKRSWAYTFLNGPLEVIEPDDFGRGDDTVLFQYEGSAGLGDPQLPRNDRTCIPSHVAPFSCDTYFSTGGTGSLAFLGAHVFRLAFSHLNGQLTASLVGGCNALSYVLQPDGNTVVASDSLQTLMGCDGEPGRQDHAVTRFFSGSLVYRIEGDRVTFTDGASTAEFSRRLPSCDSTAATPLFCGSYTARNGNGSVAFLSSSPYRVTLGRSAGQLTATVYARCSVLTSTVKVGSSLRFHLRPTESNPCPVGANRDDQAIEAFFLQSVTYRIDGDTVSLQSGPSSSMELVRGR